jgi:hypothetical protein
MKNVNRKFAALLIPVLLLLPVLRVDCQSKGPVPLPDSMTIWQSRRMVVASLAGSLTVALAYCRSQQLSIHSRQF